MYSLYVHYAGVSWNKITIISLIRIFSRETTRNMLIKLENEQKKTHLIKTVAFIFKSIGKQQS